MGRGGKRPGAGRKTESPRVAISARVNKETKAALDELRAQGITTGQFLDKVISWYLSTYPGNDISKC